MTMPDYVELTLDGVPLLLPQTLEPRDTLAIGVTPSAIGPRVESYSYGDGLPDVMDTFEWEIGYEGMDQAIYAATIDTLEDLRTSGGVHLFCDWSGRRYTYTARSGQQFFYLPRQDAFSRQYAGHTSGEWKATVTRNGVALTVLYKTSVLTGDVVPSGEVWISDATRMHAHAGRTVAAFKVGTPNSLGDVIKVRFYPVYRVGVQAVSTSPGQAGVVGLESRSIYLPEVA
jgi:hypothetical protein